MNPSVTFNQGLNSLLPYSKQMAQLPVSVFPGRVKPSNLQNFIFCQFGRMGTFPTRLNSFNGNRMGFSSRLSSLGHFICDIIGIGPKKKMIWVTTLSVVAFVQALETHSNCSIHQRPCNAVGALVKKTSVAIPEATAGPQPASIGTINLAPEVGHLIFSELDHVDSITPVCTHIQHLT